MKKYPAIQELLPHREPMILLDEVRDATEASITCSVELRPGSSFVENGSVQAFVTVEYMAQCVATYAGLKAYRRGDRVQTGYLIGVSTVDLAVDQIDVGELLIVRANHIWGDDSLGKFECTVDSNGLRVAAGVLTVFQGDPDAVELARAGRT